MFSTSSKISLSRNSATSPRIPSVSRPKGDEISQDRLLVRYSRFTVDLEHSVSVDGFDIREFQHDHPCRSLFLVRRRKDLLHTPSAHKFRLIMGDHLEPWDNRAEATAGALVRALGDKWSNSGPFPQRMSHLHGGGVNEPLNPIPTDTLLQRVWASQSAFLLQAGSSMELIICTVNAMNWL